MQPIQAILEAQEPARSRPTLRLQLLLLRGRENRENRELREPGAETGMDVGESPTERPAVPVIVPDEGSNQEPEKDPATGVD